MGRDMLCCNVLIGYDMTEKEINIIKLLYL